MTAMLRPSSGVRMPASGNGHANMRSTNPEALQQPRQMM